MLIYYVWKFSQNATRQVNDAPFFFLATSERRFAAALYFFRNPKE